MTLSGSQSSPQDHHSSSSAGAPLVSTKNSIRSWPRPATGPTVTPAARIEASAATPAAAGTSRTSKTRPVTSMTLASGRASHQLSITAVSTVACICQAGDTGCAPGAGQPTRSHEQARPGSMDPREPR